MKITHTDAREGNVIVGLEDSSGNAHELVLNSIDAASLIGSLRASLEDAIGHPAAGNMALPGMVRVQMVETAEELIFRVYMNDRISHDYPVPKGTNLSTELKLLADRMEARNLAKLTNPSPGIPGGKPS
jgi:hypothetical protein